MLRSHLPALGKRVIARVHHEIPAPIEALLVGLALLGTGLLPPPFRAVAGLATDHPAEHLLRAIWNESFLADFACLHGTNLPACAKSASSFIFPPRLELHAEVNDAVIIPPEFVGDFTHRLAFLAKRDEA